MSALSDKKDIIKGVKLGADDYITKPINPDSLLNKIDIAVSKIGGLLSQPKDHIFH